MFFVRQAEGLPYKSTSLDGELEAQLEIFGAVGEGAADPSFEPGLIGGDKATGGKPGGVQPIEGAQLKINAAADFNFGYLHGREFDAAHFAPRSFLRNDEADIVAALIVRGYFRVVPHVAKPLSIGEAAELRPSQETINRADSGAFIVTFGDPDVGDAPRRQPPEPDLETVRILPGWKSIKAMPLRRIRDRVLPILATLPAEGIHIEPARGDFKTLLKTAGEIRGRIEATGKRNLGEGPPPPRAPILLRHQVHRSLQSQAFYEFIKRLADERTEDAMKMERRETSRPRDDLELKRLVEIPKDEVDGSVNAVDVVGCSRDR